MCGYQDREVQPPQPCLASRAALDVLVIAALPDAVDDGYRECALLTVPATDVVLGRLSLLRVAVAFEQLSNFGLHCPPAFFTGLNCPLLTAYRMYLRTLPASILCPSIWRPANSAMSIAASMVPFLRVKSQNSFKNPRLTVSVEPIVYLASSAALGSRRWCLAVSVLLVVRCCLLCLWRRALLLHRCSLVN